MLSQVKKLDVIWTSDDVSLGLGHRMYRRLNDVDPDDLLYEYYLEVENFDLGVTYFVPTDFINTNDQDQGKLRLSKTFEEVQERTWFRMPAFIASGDAEEISLVD